MLTQRLFLTFSELQVRIDGVFVVSRHRDAVDAAVRESTETVSRRRRHNAGARVRFRDYGNSEDVALSDLRAKGDDRDAVIAQLRAELASQQAPDVDGKIILTNGEARPGDLRRVVITQASEYDLIADLLDEDGRRDAPIDISAVDYD